eukprot:4152815-Alexandrium_andersonii.AAC.1
MTATLALRLRGRRGTTTTQSSWRGRLHKWLPGMGMLRGHPKRRRAALRLSRLLLLWRWMKVQVRARQWISRQATRQAPPLMPRAGPWLGGMRARRSALEK